MTKVELSPGSAKTTQCATRNPGHFEGVASFTGRLHFRVHSQVSPGMLPGLDQAVKAMGTGPVNGINSFGSVRLCTC